MMLWPGETRGQAQGESFEHVLVLSTETQNIELIRSGGHGQFGKHKSTFSWIEYLVCNAAFLFLHILLLTQR